MNLMTNKPFELLSKASNAAIFKKKFLNVPIEEMNAEIIKTSDGKFKTVLKVADPLNVSMMDNKGIEKAIQQTRAALNSLDSLERCQILITSDEIDISQYINELDTKMQKNDDS